MNLSQEFVFLNMTKTTLLHWHTDIHTYTHTHIHTYVSAVFDFFSSHLTFIKVGYIFISKPYVIVTQKRIESYTENGYSTLQHRLFKV